MSDENLELADGELGENPVDRDPGLQAIPDDYVPVMDPTDFETANIVCATLSSAGIHAVMQNPTPNPAANFLAGLGNTYSHAVYVALDDVDAARALLNAPAPTEEELAAEQAADPTTLEEAEDSIRNA